MPAGPERFKVYQGAERRLLDDGAWITLYQYASRALIRPTVKGLERSPLSTAPEFLARCGALLRRTRTGVAMRAPSVA